MQTFPRTIDSFVGEIGKGEAGKYSTLTSRFFTESIKESYENIVMSAVDESVPLQIRKDEINNFLDDVEDTCITGMDSRIRIRSEALSWAKMGVQGVVQGATSSHLDALILDFCCRTYQHSPNYVGNEIHYVNAHRNYLAHGYGVSERDDPLAPSAEVSSKLEACRGFVASRMTPENLLEFMGDRCLQDIQKAYLKNWPRRSLDDALTVHEMNQVAKYFSEELAGALKTNYGGIEGATLFEALTELDPEGHPFYKIVSGSTLLQREIARNLSKHHLLFKDDEVAPYKMEFIQGGKAKTRSSAWAAPCMSKRRSMAMTSAGHWRFRTFPI